MSTTPKVKKIKAKTVYVTRDEEQFETKKAAEAHADWLDLKDEVDKLVDRHIDQNIEEYHEYWSDDITDFVMDNVDELQTLFNKY